MIDRGLRLVVEREVRETARRKGTWFVAAITLLGSALLVYGPSVFGDDVLQGDVAIVESSDALVSADEIAATIAAIDGAEITTRLVEPGVDPVQLVTADEADLVVVPLADQTSLVVDDEMSTLVAAVRRSIADRTVAVRLDAAGIDEESVTAAFAAAVPTITPVDAQREARRGAAFGIAIVIYFITVLLTSQVASGVAVEKTNRVSEVLLAILPARSLMYGKVIGVAIIGIANIVAAALPVVVRLMSGGDLPSGIGLHLAASALWYVAGLSLYLTLAAALGSLVARQEEIGSSIFPLTMSLIAGYGVAVAAPDSVGGVALSYFPLTSPMVTPARITADLGNPFEYAASILILVASVVIVGRVGSTVFRRAIVRTGNRLKLRDALRSSPAVGIEPAR